MWGFTVVINTLLCAILALKMLKVYQLNSYRLKSDTVSVMTLFYIEVACATSLIIHGAVSYFAPAHLAAIGYTVGLLPIVGYIVVDYMKKSKTPLVYTKRIWRQIVAIIALSAAMSIGVRYLSNAVSSDYMMLSSLDFVLLPLTFCLSIVVVRPIERYYYKRFVAYAKEQLSRGNLLKIGITGSYGKTTVKNILDKMLSYKYKTLATPKSYNTPLGIALATRDITPETQIFIAEMGARRIGDIKELADIVKPKIGIITGIAPQHIESFKTIDNVISTKAELIDSLPQDGVAFFNGDSKYINHIYYKSMFANKVVTTSNHGRIHIDDVNLSPSGATFTLHVGNAQKECRTRLIGKHNLSNIVLCAYVATHLGVTIDEISYAIENLTPEPHRMELISARGNITIIDDSYNCNVEGAKAALETLSTFSGRKVVVCQGIVELGAMEDKANYNIGMQLASTADIVIAVGRRGQIISNGFVEAGGNPTKLIHAKSLAVAQEMFKNLLIKGDILLLMNDLPDNY